MKELNPFIVRVAGLPAEAIDGFTSEALARQLARGRELEAEVERARSEMVDGLFAAILGAPVERRRFLLQVKRDCFNGKPLARHRSSPLWPELEAVCGAAANRLLSLEEDLAAWEGETEEDFRSARGAQRRWLLELSRDPVLRRGLTLASPELVANLNRLERPDNAFGRKERSLEASLLRYTSRAIVKLSPYSTFTRLALGVVKEGLPPGAARYVGASWSSRSLLRLKRYLLDQVNQALLRYPPVRRSLPVALNNTLEEASRGRYRYLRLGYWDVHPESGELRYFFDSFVQMNLDPGRFERLQAILGAGARPYGELVSALPGDDAAGESAEAFIDRLLRFGFLYSELPWPSNDGHLEKSMLAFLGRWPGDEGLAKLHDLVERLVALEEGYPQTPAPVASLEEIDRIIDETWQVASGLGGFSPGVSRRRSRKGCYYEDVFLLAEPRPEGRQVLELPGETARQLLASTHPLVRLAYLHSNRHDFLHSLAAFMLQRWPGRREVGFLELFSAAQPLWKELSQYKVDTRPPGGLLTAFNPLGLERIEELRRLKEEIWSQVDRWHDAGPVENRISGAALAALLEPAPPRYAPTVGACLLVQMADPEGRLWVLNRLYEGTGRYASRFTPVMDEESRRRYTEHYTSRSAGWHDGREMEFLDLLRPQGDTLNVHSLQTARILELPGEPSHLPASRLLSLRDLRVRVDEESLLPYLVDASGRELQALHLGGTGPLFMPPLMRFLAMLGPGEILPVFPPRPGIPTGDATVRNRLTIDNVVLQRKRWIFYPGAIPTHFSELREEAAFLAINRWRLDRGLPERMFLLEATPHFVLADRYKPQYIDFTSPLFVSLFRSALKTSAAPLVLEEPLPAPGVLPRDTAGNRWAVELQLDSFTLRPRQGRETPIVTASEAALLPSSARRGDFTQPEPVGLIT